MVEADEIDAGALGRLVRLEVQDRQVDHAVGQEHALGQRPVQFRHFLKANASACRTRRSPTDRSTLSATWRR